MNYNEIIQKLGRKIKKDIYYYDDNNNKIEIERKNIGRIKNSFRSSLTGTIMRELVAELNVNITYPIYLKITASYGEYSDSIEFGPFFLKEKAEYEASSKKYIHNYCDYMIQAMKDYQAINITYPCSVYDFFKRLIKELNLTTNIASIPNGERVMNSDIYTNIGFTYRDVLDDIAKANGILLYIYKDEVKIAKFGENNVIITDKLLKNVNIEFGKHYGPINSIVLSRAGESDNVYLKDNESIEKNGLTEFKIIDNQLMNDNNRSDYLPALLEQLKNVEYDIFDTELTGFGNFEMLQQVTFETGGNVYKSYVFNNEVEIENGYTEVIYTEQPSETETDYKAADKTDRRINQTYLIVNKQNQTIEALANEVNEFDESITKLTLDVDGIRTDVNELNDFRRENSGNNYVTTDNAAEGPIVNLELKGQIDLIYPAEDLYPSDDLYPLDTNLIISSDPNMSLDKLTHTAEGNPIYIEDAGAYDLEKLYLEGNAYQETTEGSNLVDWSNPTKNQSYTKSTFENDILIANTTGGVYQYAGWDITSLFKNNIGKTLCFKCDNIDFSNTQKGTVQINYNTDGNMYYPQLVTTAGQFKAITITETMANCTTATLCIYLNNSGTAGAYSITIPKPMLYFGDLNNPPAYEPYTTGASPNPDYPQEIEVVDKGKNLFDKDSIDVGYIKEDGTIHTDSAYCTSDFIPVQPNTAYYKTATTSPRTKFFDKDKNILDSSTYQDISIGGNAGTFTTPSTAYYFRFSYPIATIDSASIQIEKGSTATKYQPYNSIANNVRGKNLFDGIITNEIVSVSGVITSNASWSLSDYIQVDSNTDYTLSHDDTASEQSLIISEYDENQAFIKRNTQGVLKQNKSYTITTSSTTKYVRLNYNNTFNNSNFQLEKGSTATEYEPYQEANYVIDLQDNFLAKIGDVADELDVVTGKLTKRIGKIVLDGSESWESVGDMSTDDIHCYAYTNVFDELFSTNTSDFRKSMCNRLPFLSGLWAGGTIDKEVFSITSSTSRLRIAIKKSRLSSINKKGLTDYLSKNPITIYYVLAEPYEVQLDQTQITLFEGVNNISISTNLEPSKVSVEYYNNKPFNIVHLPIDRLNYTSETNCDIFKVENGTASIVRANGSVEDKGELLIPLFEGYNKIFMQNFPNVKFNIMYAVKNDLLDVFATKLETKSQINQTAQEINLEVSKKIDGTEVISTINQSAEQITLTSNRLVVNSDNFKLTKDGTLEATNGLFSGNISSSTINLTSEGETDAKYTITDYENTGCVYSQSARLIRWKGFRNGTIEIWNTLSYPTINLITGAKDYAGILTPTSLMFNRLENGEFAESITAIDLSGITTPKVTQTSLAESKKNIELYTGALKEIKKTDIYKYNLKTETDGTKKHLGFVIGRNYNYSSEITAIDENSKEIGVDNYSMTSLCLQAIKELLTKVEILELKIKELEGDK